MARFVALRVLLVLGGLAALYLLLGNVLIKTAILKRLANTSPSVQLDYGSAYTLFPGRVHVTGLELRSEDYNVQFEVTAESATLDVNLLALAARRFHALRVRAEGVGFRARHKVHEVGLDARRLAAYPPISGFKDPPLYEGKQPGPISDEEYNLWEVVLDDVEGSAHEIWILEHRFAGKATVTGGFRLRPARSFEVRPARLELESGTLSIAGVPTAREVRATLTCEVTHTDVQSITGLEVLRTVSANLTLTGKHGDLAAANVYTEPRLGARAKGQLGWQARLRVKRGVIEQGSAVELTSQDFSLKRDRDVLTGDVHVRLLAPAPGVLSFCASAREATLERPAASPKLDGPKLDGATLCASLAPADTAAPISLKRVTGSIRKLDMPELEWWTEPLTRAGSRLRLSGATNAEVSFTATPNGELELRSQAELHGAFVSDGELGVLATGKVEVAIEPSQKAPRVSHGTLLVDVPHVKFAREREISEELGFRLRSTELTFQNVSNERRLSGSAELEGRNVRALLELAVAPAALAGSLLGVRDLNAPVHFAMTADSSRVEVPKAKSGALEVSGFIAATKRGPTSGAFLFETPIANFGLSLRGSQAELASLVSDDWLPKGWAKLTSAARR